MKKGFLWWAVMLLSYTSFAQKREAQLLDSILTSEYNKKQFNGNVLVADKGKVIFEKSYGLANVETQEKLNTNSIFELASVSKQFTAMAIVLLQKQGKLQYDEPVSKYIPELSFYPVITIRNLVVHTSGLPDYMELFDEKWDKTKFATNQDIVNEFAKYKPALEFMPGEKFEYSNTGYAFLATIIERTSKQSFGEYLHANIFKPLQMKNTFIYRSRYEPKKVNNYAYGYVMDSMANMVLTNTFGKEYYTYFLDGIVGDGMVNSTIHDLLIWDRALYGNKLVNEKDKELIFGASKTTDGKENKYGFGWIVNTQEKYGKTASHSGGWAGYVTYIERHMDNDKTIIVLQNHSGPLTKIPSKSIRQVLYSEPFDKVIDSSIAVTPEELVKYGGVYASDSFPMKITVFPKGNILYARATGQNPFPLSAYPKNVFRFAPARIELTFIPEENVMIYIQGKNNVRFKKE
jgi:CubicO group peptidase (beta-lactamase class C family)